LILKKSCCKELLRFYARQNAWHCSRACSATTSRPGTSALQPPLCRCVSTPGKILRYSHVCAAVIGHGIDGKVIPAKTVRLAESQLLE
jgi:hypothetical protein